MGRHLTCLSGLGGVFSIASVDGCIGGGIEGGYGGTCTSVCTVDGCIGGGIEWYELYIYGGIYEVLSVLSIRLYS